MITSVNYHPKGLLITTPRQLCVPSRVAPLVIRRARFRQARVLTAGRVTMRAALPAASGIALQHGERDRPRTHSAARSGPPRGYRTRVQGRRPLP